MAVACSVLYYVFFKKLLTHPKVLYLPVGCSVKKSGLQWEGLEREEGSASHRWIFKLC